MQIYTYTYIFISIPIFPILNNFHAYIYSRPPVFTPFFGPDEISLFRPPGISEIIYKRALSKLNDFLMNGGEILGNISDDFVQGSQGEIIIRGIGIGVELCSNSQVHTYYYCRTIIIIKNFIFIIRIIIILIIIVIFKINSIMIVIIGRSKLSVLWGP